MKASAAITTGSSFTAAELVERTMHRRAVEAIVWGIPAVNFDVMLQSFLRDAKGRVNQFAYWSRIPDWKNQTLTPNPDTIYLMPFFDTREVGPIVIEIPPAEGGSITGTIMNCWQEALEDVGPAGLDQGRGGRYLVTPPGLKDAVPAGYLHLSSTTNQGYALLRSLVKMDPRPEGALRGPVPLLRSRQARVRQELGAARHREGRLTRTRHRPAARRASLGDPT
jgi:hypothetical protein